MVPFLFPVFELQQVCVNHVNLEMVPFLFSSPGQYSRDGILKRTTQGRRGTNPANSDNEAGGHQDIDAQTRADTDRRRPTQAETDGHRWTQTGTARHRRTQTDTDRHRQTQTDTASHGIIPCGRRFRRTHKERKNIHVHRSHVSLLCSGMCLF